MAIYLSLSVIFVNTTDNHLLTSTSRETRGHEPEPDLYNRVVNYFYRKLIVVEDENPAPKPPAVDSVLVKLPAQPVDSKPERKEDREAQ